MASPSVALPSGFVIGIGLLRSLTICRKLRERSACIIKNVLGGVLISALEPETVAKKYLAQASINKEEALLNYSLIKSDLPIQEPKQASFMEVILHGIDPSLSLPSDDLQQCGRQGDDVLCRVDRRSRQLDHESVKGNLQEAERHLRPTLAIPSAHPLIRSTSHEIAGMAGAPDERIRRLIDWIQHNIQQEAVDVFTALDLLSGRKAECQGHSYLYAAFARALGIPLPVWLTESFTHRATVDSCTTPGRRAL